MVEYPESNRAGQEARKGSEIEKNAPESASTVGKKGGPVSHQGGPKTTQQKD